MNLGKRIQDLRRRRGLSTGELAAQVQVTSGFISQLEHSKTEPSLQTLQRVAAALQVTTPNPRSFARANAISSMSAMEGCEPRSCLPSPHARWNSCC
jgi:transcriptional regulator with XRE-family HTH domain